MVVDNFQEILSFRESNWLGKYISFNTQLKNQASNGFEKDFYKLLKTAFCGRTVENFRVRMKVEIIKKRMIMMKC